MTIVRLELLAAIVGLRLRKTVECECRYKFERVIHLVDSEIVRAMIQRDSYGFNTFTSTRIGEIQEGSDPNDWFWVNGENNVADLLITRGEKPVNLGVGSIWQDGPEYLKLPMWPIRQDCSLTMLPEQAKKLLHISTSLPLISIDRFSDYVKLIKVTARILSLKKIDNRTYSLKRISDGVTVEKFEDAVKYWVAES